MPEALTLIATHPTAHPASPTSSPHPPGPQAHRTHSQGVHSQAVWLAEGQTVWIWAAARGRKYRRGLSGMRNGRAIRGGAVLTLSQSFPFSRAAVTGRGPLPTGEAEALPTRETVHREPATFPTQVHRSLCHSLPYVYKYQCMLGPCSNSWDLLSAPDQPIDTRCSRTEQER